MALTRPKYSQIYDSDAKNSARVATTTSVTLTGGAPSTVDDIALALKDRVLVKSQANTAQNGIYYVTVVGTGSNGTWLRSLDADSNVKLTAGATLSVEEGTVNAGKMFRMTSTGTIIWGSSAITWTDVSGGGGASTGGTNGQFQYNDNNSLNGSTYFYYNKTTGLVTANAGIASTSTTTGSFIVTGGAGVSGELYVGANVTVTGNVLPSANITYNLGSPSQRWKDLYLAGNTINLSGATITAANGAITFQNSLGGSFSVTGAAGGQSTGTFGNLVANSGVASTTTTTGALVVTGGAGISGDIYAGGLQNTPIGSTTASSGAFTSLTSSLTTKSSGNLVAASGTASTNTTTGALVVVGGIGASGAIYAGSLQNTPIGSTTASSGAFTTVTASSTLAVTGVSTLSGNVVAASGTASTTVTSGALVVAGGAGVSGAVTVGGQINSTATTAATSTITGAFVTAGGIGVAKDSYFGANVTIAGNLVITGNNFSIDSATLNIQDPIINLHSPSDLAPLTVDDGADIGIKFHYYKGGDRAAFLGWQNSTGYLEWYDSGSDTGNVFTGSTQGTIKTGQLILSNSTASSSTTTGALVVTGGAGIGGAVNIGGALSASSLSGTGAGISSLGTTTNYQVGSMAIGGSRVGSAGLSVNGTTDDNDSQIIIKKPSQSVWSMLTWNNVNYQGYNIYYDNGTWVHSAPTGSNVNSLLATTSTGTSWYGSDNGTSSWNQASNQPLWDLTGAWVGKINTTSAQTIAPSANLTYNLGSTTAWWNNVYGVSVQAKYADLAEHYEPDQGYANGTVVVFGGDKEITVTAQDHDTRVAGVISTNPAYLMNAANPGLPVALQGRVPCQVLGPVAKGDVLVTSNIPGVAQRIDNARFLPGCVVGKALEAINTNTIQTIEVVVGRF